MQLNKGKSKGKAVLYRSIWSRGLQEVEAARMSTQSAHEGGKVVSTGRLYPPRKIPWYSFPLEAESTPGT